MTTLRALQTPFLITNEALVNEIVSDDELAGELMSGLDAAGVVGLALFPEGLRHPFAFGDPLLGPEDYQGAVMQWITSATTAAVFDALGATPGAEADPSTLAGAESSYFFAPGGTATGNVTFFPKVNSLVINEGVWAGLTEDQQAILTSAAADTRDWAIDHTQSDHDAALERCANGFGIVLASDDDLAGLAEATAPVVAELRGDPATAELIDEITALRDALPPMAIEPVTCDAAPVTTSPSVEDTAAAASVGESQEFPDGVYQMEVTSDELLARGVPPEQAYNGAGVNTMTFDNGTWRAEDPSGGSCGGTYEVVAGGRVAVRTPCNPGNGVLFEANWTLDGDQLQFTDLTTETDTQAFVDGFWGGQPWTRIGDAGPAAETTIPSVEDTATPASVGDSEEFPDGVYQREVTSDELLAHGADPESAYFLGGVNTLTFDNGTQRLDDASGAADFATYTVDAGRITVVAPEGFVIFEASWTLDGDQLQFTEVVTFEPDPQFNDLFEWFWAGPWTRIGDAPATTVPA